MPAHAVPMYGLFIPSAPQGSCRRQVSKVPQPLERLIRSPHHRLWGNKDDLLAGMGDASGAERRPSGHLPGCVCSVLTKGDRPHCVVSLAQRGQVGDVGLSACLLPPLRLLPGAT
jgi:hypothetical protein